MLHTEQGYLPCEQNNTSLWFSHDPGSIHLAKQLCNDCPRRALCLEDALATGELLGTELVGVHGGLTEPERTRLRERRSK